MKWTEEDIEIRDLVKNLYKQADGSPIILTWGQTQIFKAIAKKEYPRWFCSCFTRYGKSLVVALAVLTRITTFPEKWAIVSGTKKKASIIMNYVNEHIFDNEYTASKFRLQSGETAESIKRHRNKSHITFDLGGGKMSELFIATSKDAIGLGSPNLVEDEASLIPDDEQALIQRMIGDNPNDNFLFKIGNPFYRNHFHRSSMDPNYKQLVLDYHTGLEEGRISQAIIDENRAFAYFGVLYECRFPSAEEMDDTGWMYLLNDDDIKNAQERHKLGVLSSGEWRMGVDVARGGRNFNVWGIRNKTIAKIVKKNLDPDLMSVVATTIEIMKEYNIKPENVFIDDVGVGGGVVDRLKELGYNVNAVKEGASAEDSDEFLNMRAEAYAGKEGIAQWIKEGGAIEPHEDLNEFTRIRYKKNSNGKTKIESKDEMRKRGEESPDVADALMLTCAKGYVKKKFYQPSVEQILNGRRVDEF